MDVVAGGRRQQPQPGPRQWGGEPITINESQLAFEEVSSRRLTATPTSVAAQRRIQCGVGGYKGQFTVNRLTSLPDDRKSFSLIYWRERYFLKGNFGRS